MFKKVVFITISLILLYLYIHNPLFSVFGGIGSCKLLYPLCIVYLLNNYSLWIKVIKLFKIELLFLVSLILFSLLRSFVGGDFTFLYLNIVMLIECFLLPIVFSIFWIKNGYTRNDFITLFLLCSSVASIITLLCISIPSFGFYVRFNLLLVSDYLQNVTHRGFGISDSLTSIYGYVQGASVVLGLYYLKYNKWFVFFMPLVALSALFNARTGIVVAFVGIILYFLYYKQLSKILFLSCTVFILLFISSLLLDYLDLPDETRYFIEQFFKELDVSSANDVKENSGTAMTLYNMIQLPNGLDEWILGRGVSIFGGFKGSDVGYCIQLVYGGLIYVGLLYGFAFRVFKRLRRTVFGDNLLSLFYILSIIILNVKADILTSNGYFRFMLLFLYVSVVYQWWFSMNVKNIKS